MAPFASSKIERGSQKRKYVGANDDTGAGTACEFKLLILPSHLGSKTGQRHESHRDHDTREDPASPEREKSPRGSASALGRFVWSGKMMSDYGLRFGHRRSINAPVTGEWHGDNLQRDSRSS